MMYEFPKKNYTVIDLPQLIKEGYLLMPSQDSLVLTVKKDFKYEGKYYKQGDIL